MRMAELVVVAVVAAQLSALLVLCQAATSGRRCYALPDDQARQGAVLVSWNTSLLVVCGSYLPHCGPELPTHYDDIWASSAGAATPWRRFARLGRANARTHHAAVVLSDVLYVLGGYGGPNHTAPVPLDSVVSLVLGGSSGGTSGSLRVHRPLPIGPATNLAVTTTLAQPGVVFVAGGFVYPRVGAKVAQGETSAAVFTFRPASDAWTPLPPMRVARGAFVLAALPTANAITLGGGLGGGDGGSNTTLVAAGGFSRSRTTGKFAPLALVEGLALRPGVVSGVGRWSALQPLPAARSQAVGVITKMPSPPPPQREVAVAGVGVGLDEHPALVLLGGTNATKDWCYTGTSIMQRSVVVLTAAGRGWRTMNEFKRPRGFMAAATLGGAVVAVGGFNGTQDAPAVDVLDLATQTWTSCV
jgi:hypothetical protein|eukprot:COSAG01_NODE_8355_length_2818_cov_17.918067_5_plen_414_part_01